MLIAGQRKIRSNVADLQVRGGDCRLLVLRLSCKRQDRKRHDQCERHRNDSLHASLLKQTTNKLPRTTPYGNRSTPKKARPDCYRVIFRGPARGSIETPTASPHPPSSI